MVCSAMVSCFFFWFFFCKDLDNNSFFSKNLYFLHTELTHAYSNSYPPPILQARRGQLPPPLVLSFRSPMILEKKKFL